MPADLPAPGQPGPSSILGLGEVEAQLRLAQDGPNELPASRRRGPWRLMGEVVTEPMFLLLVACGVIYMVLGDRHEALMLLGFVFVVMGITFVQQQRTERSLDALRDLSSPRALVLRDGQLVRVAGRQLVCEDIVLLAEGDRVPADLELVDASNLAVDESLLTGESVPIDKQVMAVSDGGSPPVEADLGRVFSGTLVTRGTARGRVIATGPRSALGRIAQSLAALGVEKTPIQQETQKVVKRVALIGVAVATGLALVA